MSEKSAFSSYLKSNEVKSRRGKEVHVNFINFTRFLCERSRLILEKKVPLCRPAKYNFFSHIVLHSPSDFLKFAISTHTSYVFFCHKSRKPLYSTLAGLEISKSILF